MVFPRGITSALRWTMQKLFHNEPCWWQNSWAIGSNWGILLRKCPIKRSQKVSCRICCVRPPLEGLFGNDHWNAPFTSTHSRLTRDTRFSPFAARTSVRVRILVTI